MKEERGKMWRKVGQRESKGKRARKSREGRERENLEKDRAEGEQSKESNRGVAHRDSREAKRR